jgi:hypothetical protein
MTNDRPTFRRRYRQRIEGNRVWIVAIVAAVLLPTPLSALGGSTSVTFHPRRAWNLSGGNPRLVLARLAQYIAAPPYRLDVVLAVRGVGELLAQLADELIATAAPEREA